MGENNKELVKKDLSLILQLNTKVHYENREEVKQVYDWILRKKIFQTPLGTAYINKLGEITNGVDNSNQCLFCAEDLYNQGVICPNCVEKYARPGAQKKPEPKKTEAAGTQETMIQDVRTNINYQQQVSDISKQAAAAVKGGLNTITSKINEMAGESGAVELKLRDLFSNVFKKHTRKESEEIFIAGTLETTPDESMIAVSWPKPWLFSRVLFVLLLSFGLLYVCATEFGNSNVIPGMIFLGALAVPFSVMIFIFETNAPRNISIFEVIKMFFFGGAASLVLTLFLYEMFPPGKMNYAGAFIVGIVEELGKVLAAAIFIKMLNPKYILNGMLIGAAVGAGFAVFESAGYIFRFGILNYLFLDEINAFMNILVLRAWTSVGGHVVWTAIVGAGLVLAKGEEPFVFSQLLHPKCMTFFMIAAALHAIWDCPLQFYAGGINVKLLLLIAAAWIVLLVLLSVGLKQIEKITAKTA